MAEGSGHTLLERIAKLGRGGRFERSSGEDPQAVADSVERNLARLLNSRHGMSQAQPDYGLPALNDLLADRPDSILVLQEAIRVTIERYEPRVRRVRVVHVADEASPRRLSFVIEGTLVGKGEQNRVSLGASLSGAGRFTVAL